MEITKSRIITLRALISQLRTATRLLTEIVDEFEDAPACPRCLNKGVFFIPDAHGVATSAICPCSRGDEFRGAARKSGRDKAAGET